MARTFRRTVGNHPLEYGGKRLVEPIFQVVADVAAVKAIAAADRALDDRVSVTALTRTAAIRATLNLSTVAYEAVTAGIAANAITVRHVAGTGPSASTVATLSGSAVTITLGTDADSVVDATVADVVAAIAAAGTVAALIAAATSGLFVAVKAAEYLEGGADAIATQFEFSPDSTATGDDTTVIAPTSGFGRWLIVDADDNLPMY